jgi:hypothetical protein
VPNDTHGRGVPVTVYPSALPPVVFVHDQELLRSCVSC